MNKETKELIYNTPSIKNLQPHYFRNTSPIEDITASEDEEFSRLSLELMRIYRNNYLNTADEDTLGIYEFLYGVTPPYQNKDIYVFLGGEDTPPTIELPEGAEIRYLPANLEVVKLSGSQMISKFISQTVEDNKLYLVENRDIDALVESVNKSAVVDGFVVRVYGTDYIAYLPDINVHGERRARIANRESTKPPFTKRFLVNKLNELLGEGNYTLMIDYPNSTIQIESTNPSQSWAEEVYITINNIKPASMVYLNIPVDSNEVIVEEGVSLSQYLYNYRLGTQWVLGKKAFTSFEDLGEVKSMAINSFTPLAHTKAADFLITQVAKVRLNGDDDKMITTFISKNTVGGIGELVYEVPSGFVTAVNKVDLMDSANGILSTSNIYVPVPGTTQIKHRFRVRNVS